MEKPSLLRIFISFCKVGALTFGGGYSMLPILEREAVDKHHWLEAPQIADYYALAQCSPGLIAVNVSVYVAFPLRGIAGAVMAGLGVITPSIIIILLLASLLSNFAHLPLLGHAFAGVRVAVAALILQAAYKLYKSGVIDKAGLVVFAVVLVLSVLGWLGPLWVVVGAAVAGIIIQSIKARQGGQEVSGR